MTDISLLFEPPLARVVLNRPERRNAISRAMWRALPAIRAAIEARAGRAGRARRRPGGHFSAGADISEFDEVYRDAAAAARLWRRRPGRPQGADRPRPALDRGA